MPEKHLYEYAVVRIVPRVEREEFINAGVILYCKRLQFLRIRYHIDSARLKAFCPAPDTNEVARYLQSMERICAGGTAGGPIGSLDMPSRFRWLTATRSTVVQTSKVHAGFCRDAEEAMNSLFEQLVKPEGML